MYNEMKNWSKKEQIKYIKGFTDGEGGPVMYRGKKVKNNRIYPQWDRKIAITNSDKKLLFMLKKTLKGFNIESHIYLNHKKGTGRCTIDSWQLVVLGKENIERFGKIIGFTNIEKQAKFNQISASYR